MHATSATITSAGRLFLPGVLLLFVGSGCSALIYEIVWFQMLQLVIGSSALSLACLLGTFMGGMCLGSLLVPRMISRTRHPLRAYAALELGIGVLGVVVLFTVPYVDRAYVASLGAGTGSVALRAVVCAICLLPPALLMGATLPVIGRWVDASPRGLSWLGFFYGGNIAGAVVGCLLAGFYLLRLYDVAVATAVAVAINFAVAALAVALARAAGPGRSAARTIPHAGERVTGGRAVYVVIALSGLCALGAEVVWTRLLSLMLGATVYTFSIILAVFLVGLGIGSAVGANLCRRVDPRVVLGVCQLLLTAAVAWTALMLARSLPYWPIQPSLSGSPWYNLQLDLLRCAWALLPATLLWGASFPAAVAAVGAKADPGRAVGRVYAANTVGAIVGAVTFGTLVVAHFGSQQAQRTLIGVSAFAAFVALAPYLRLRPMVSWRFAGLAVALAGAVVLVRGVPATPWELVAYGRYMPSYLGQGGHLLYVGEGVNSSVAVTQAAGERLFHVSGKVEASSGEQDMRLQRMLGHLPALLHPKPRSVLIVGCGAGVTAGSFVAHPEVERIVICELEPLVPQVVAKYFSAENHGVLTDKRVQVVYDDARHYVLGTGEKFDVITSDPIHPWVKGAATLYTREYFELCKRHLKPGGVVAQWVPLYESSTGVVKTEFKTFFEAFPDGTIWSNDAEGKGYDVVLLGQAEPTRVVIDFLQERLARPDHGGVVESLQQAGFGSLQELLATYAGRGRDLEPWLRDAEVNRDRNLRLQYLAGMELNKNQSSEIHDQMMGYYRFPDGLFVASDSVRQALTMEIVKARLKRAAH